METRTPTSGVPSQGGHMIPPGTGLTSDALPEVQKPVMAENSDTGVSTRNVLLHNAPAQKKEKDCMHWYALRATYGREGKANDYLRSKNIETFYPTLKTVKFIDGKRVTREESRIPNVFFARGTEEEIKSHVYDNVNLPYLRFYYAHKHLDGKVTKEPLIIPDTQMNSLRIICTADSEDIIASPTIITKFKEGQQVRITEGKFKGVVGTVARYHSQQRVGIIIDGLMTVCTAYVPGAFLEDVGS